MTLKVEAASRVVEFVSREAAKNAKGSLKMDSFDTNMKQMAQALSHMKVVLVFVQFICVRKKRRFQIVSKFNL